MEENHISIEFHKSCALRVVLKWRDMGETASFETGESGLAVY
jgi:hypothetical protein